VRFADTEARREFFERLVERFRTDDERRRFRELDAEITRLYETGVTIPKDMRDEHALLAAKVKR
jgi:hypothetical protein